MRDDPRILIVAGEASGDLHGANLVRELKQMAPVVSLFGIGGPRMQEAGVELVRSINRMGLMGFTEVLQYLPFIRRTLKELKGLIEEQRPALAILIDYPGFNLRLAKILRNKGIPILYYIGPQVWAWGADRAKKIAQLVNRMAVIFPFEVDIYQEVGLEVEFVGHPVVEAIDPKLNKEEFCAQWGLSPLQTIFGLLPGSRRMEVLRLLPIMLQSVELIRREDRGLQVVLGLAPAVDRTEIEDVISKSRVEVRLVEGLTQDVIKHSDLLLVASGTATLESTCLGTPMIILYKVGFLSWLIGRQLVKVPHIGLVNILAGRRVVPELVQFDASPQKVAAVAIDLLRDRARRERMREELLKVREKLGSGGASRRTAEVVLEMLSTEVPPCSRAFTIGLSSS